MKTCTIISRDDLPFARVLADSFSVHHGAKISILIFDDVDGLVNGEGENFDLVRPADLPLSSCDFYTMAAIYERRELACALKPWFIDYLIRQYGEAVLYLDADMEIFASLEEVSSMVPGQGIVLTPHLLEPLPRDGCLPREKDLLMAGTYNLGFIAVDAGASDFLDWWKERLRYDCIVSPGEGYFADQRWMDVLPASFSRHILRDTAYNVAYWNLASRKLTAENGGFLADGKPLRCFHFSGFSPGAPHLLSEHQGTRPRIRLSRYPAAAEICARYAGKLKKQGYGGPETSYGYGFELTAGSLGFGRELRRACRRLLREAASSGEEPSPDPFDCSKTDEFTAWLNAPLPSSPHPGISRLLAVIHESRLDLKLGFPDPYGADADRFIDWVLEYGREEYGIPAEHLPEETARRRRKTAIDTTAEPGINVAGYINSQSGLGESVRLVLQTLEASGIPHVTLAPLEATQSRQFASRQQTCEARHDVSIVCVNADQFPVFARHAGLDFFDGRYTIAVWAWELERFPGAIDPITRECVDEIWTYSGHAVKALSQAMDKPVYKFPLPVAVRPAPEGPPAGVDLPDGFVFLFCFDFLSVMERKNPLAVVEAFSQAFAPGEGAGLLIKTINGDKRIPEMERLMAAASRPDIMVMDGYLAAEDQQALVASCDAYVSLHRAEGYGLTMAEAMALKKPVIATRYSGNLEFMDDDNSYLVPYSMTRVPEDCAPYPAGYTWAQPDIEAAASLMRHVYDHPEEAGLKAERAQRDMAEKHRPESRLEFISERLGYIREMAAGESPVNRPGGFSWGRFRRSVTSP